MTQTNTDTDVANLLCNAYDFCAAISKHIFKKLEVGQNTDQVEWDKCCRMALAISEVHNDQLLMFIISDDEQRRPIARGLALSAMEDAAKSVGRRWP